MINFNLRACSSIAAAVWVCVTPLCANAQVPAIYGSTSLLQWQQMSALGNTVALGSDRITAINAGTYSITTGTGSDLAAVTRAKIPIGKASLVVDVVAKVPAASVAKAVANFAFKVFAPIQVGLALWDLAKELGMDPSQDANGQTVITKTVNDFNTIWRNDYSGYIYESAEAACQALWTPGYVFVGYSLTYNGGRVCNVDYPSQGYGIHANLMPRQGTAVVKTVPVTQQQFEDAVASKSGWPDSSAIARVLRDAINAGQSVTVTPQSVTGPASTPGQTVSSTTSGSPAVAPTPATATTAATAGSPAVDSITTTSTTTNNYTYAGSTVTVTNSTVTNITNNTTGQRQTTTTEKAPEIKNPEPAKPEPEKPEKPEDPATDTALPDQPKLYTRVYTNGIKGVWDAQKQALAGTSLMQVIPALMPSVGAGGSCPSMPVNLNYANWANFGVVDVAPPCFVWDFGKVVIILSALLLARALVFGG